MWCAFRVVRVQVHPMSTRTIKRYAELKQQALEAENVKLKAENERLRVLLGLKRKLNRLMKKEKA